jgi:hypothetical protein
LLKFKTRVERISSSPAVAFSKQQFPLIVPPLIPEFNAVELSIFKAGELPALIEGGDEAWNRELALLFNAY